MFTGDDFEGWLVTDFYAAYNLILCHYQRCWAHLLRDQHELKEHHQETIEVTTQSAPSPATGVKGEPVKASYIASMTFRPCLRTVEM